MFSDAVPLYSLNNWHHVVGVYDASDESLDLYVDGVLSNDFPVFADPLLPRDQDFLGDLTVGARPVSIMKSFRGRIDELRVSDVARSPDWVVSSYEVQSSPEAYVSWTDEEHVSSVLSCEESEEPRRFRRFRPRAAIRRFLGRGRRW